VIFYAFLGLKNAFFTCSVLVYSSQDLLTFIGDNQSEKAKNFVAYGKCLYAFG